MSAVITPPPERSGPRLCRDCRWRVSTTMAQPSGDLVSVDLCLSLKNGPAAIFTINARQPQFGVERRLCGPEGAYWEPITSPQTSE